VGSDAVVLLPGVLPGLEPAFSCHPTSWVEAAATFLEARLRGQRFEAHRRRALEESRRELRRLVQLEAHLIRDLAGLPEEGELRRDAEALLASSAPLPGGAREVEVADPYQATRTRRVAVDPALSGPRNADRLFTKARRIERARVKVEARLRETRRAEEAAREREERLLSARDTAELSSRTDAEAGSAPRRRPGGQGRPLHYLTSRGLSVLVGRGARQNHHLTFTVARPDDLWLHARDVPGAHVVLKDPEGRAGAEDLREAAEVAAFFSDARGETQADVHVTRRKHLRPGRGGPGRVVLGHTETMRVAPRDPEGRLRRR
jgi:predicted ribosome quality control (RQC) complex YloA/Tae2 family protein